MQRFSKTRIAGFLIIFICVLLFSYLLFSPDQKPQSSSVVVVYLGSESGGFPDSDYRYILSRMGLSFFHVNIRGMKAEDVRSAAREQIGKIPDQFVFMVEGRDSEIGLEMASWEETAGLILLAPETNDKQELLRKWQNPDIPVGIFFGKPDESVFLYEALSGEDASLLPGDQKGGIWGESFYLSPSADRYFVKWDRFPSYLQEGNFLYSLPQVQQKIADFLAVFILTDSDVSVKDCGRYVWTYHGIKIFSIFWLAGGVFLFFSDTDIWQKDQVQEYREAENIERRRFYRGQRRKIFLFRFFAVIFFCVILFILIRLVDHSTTAFILCFWPVIYFLIPIVVFKKALSPKSQNELPADEPVPEVSATDSKGKPFGFFSGKAISGFLLSLLLLAALYFLRRLQVFSAIWFSKKTDLVIFGIFVLFLATVVSVHAFLNTKLQQEERVNQEETSRIQKNGAGGLLLIPTLFLLACSIATGRLILVKMCIEIGVAAGIFLFCRRMLQKCDLPYIFIACISSLYYALLLFG